MSALTDAIPSKYRKSVYAVIAFASLVVGVWQATDHDWKAFAVALVVALSHSLAASNVDTSAP